MLEEQQEKIIYELNIAHSVRIQPLQYKYLGKYQESLQNTGVDPESTLKGTIELEGERKGNAIKIDLEKYPFNLTICWRCRSILIPGMNLQIRIKYCGKDKQKKRGSTGHKHKTSNDRSLEYRCLNCNAVAVFTELLAQKAGRYFEKGKNIETNSMERPKNKQLENIPVKANARRKRHHHGTALSELLQRKRKKDNKLHSQHKMDGLDLFDFMKR